MLREAHTRLLPYLQDPAGIRITDLAQAVGVTKQAVQPWWQSLRPPDLCASPRMQRMGEPGVSF